MGRPKGYSPGQRRLLTHQVGEWAWCTDNLHKRIQKTGADDCWAWTGSKTPHGNIFGAYKNGRQQMTQANRLLYMEQCGHPIDNLTVRMSCGNSYCANPAHFRVIPYNRKKTKKPMMLIEENLYTEGQNPQAQRLTQCLKEFFDQEPFANGLDWSTQTLWAKMTEGQAVMFALKYPQYAGRFRKV